MPPLRQLSLSRSLSFKNSLQLSTENLQFAHFFPYLTYRSLFGLTSHVSLLHSDGDVDRIGTPGGGEEYVNLYCVYLDFTGVMQILFTLLTSSCSLQNENDK